MSPAGRRSRAIVALCLLVGCASGAESAPAASPTPSASPAPIRPQARLTAILATELTAAQDSAYRLFGRAHGERLEDLLAAVAVNADAPALARANAVVRLTALGYHDFDVLERTLGDPDPRVRGATIGALSPFLSEAPERLRPLMMRALLDREPAVQAKALQELGGADPSLLRWFLGTNTAPGLDTIAHTLLMMAESRGAPLVPDSAGALARTDASGVVLLAQNVDGAIGAEADERFTARLTASAAGGPPIVLTDSALIVGNVIPAAVSPGGRFVAYEAAGRIHVRDLETGADRIVGTGIAPRAFPFTGAFLYAVRVASNGEVPSADGAPMYQLMRAPFAPGPPVLVARFDVDAPGAREAADRIRRARIIQVDGGLAWTGRGFAVALPSPFDDSPAASDAPDAGTPAHPGPDAARADAQQP